jgi:pimeloyl-ACP methyl ester carboxylesterase
MLSYSSFSKENIRANGVNFHVRHGGSGPAVLLMHGWCGSSHTWRKLAPLLAQDHVVIAPDMKGYGRSDKPEQGYDAMTAASEMAAILDHFGIEKAHVVGHDMGAPVALVFAGLFPERTLTAIYMDEPLLGFDTERYTAFTQWNHGGYWQFGLHNTPGMPELFYKGNEEAFLRIIFDAMTVVKDALTEEDIAEHAFGMKSENGIRGMTGWYRAAFSTGEQINDIARKQAVKCPTLAICGERGVAGIVKEIKQAVPHATGITVAGSGHLMPEEKPEDLAKALRTHFATSS